MYQCQRRQQGLILYRGPVKGIAPLKYQLALIFHVFCHFDCTVVFFELMPSVAPCEAAEDECALPFPFLSPLGSDWPLYLCAMAQAPPSSMNIGENEKKFNFKLMHGAPILLLLAQPLKHPQSDLVLLPTRELWGVVQL
jgi:hypothetical protein